MPQGLFRESSRDEHEGEARQRQMCTGLWRQYHELHNTTPMPPWRKMPLPCRLLPSRICPNAIEEYSALRYSSFFRTWFELTTKDIYRVRTHADIDTHGMACVSTHAHLIDTFYVCLRKQKDVCMSANGALYYNAHTYLFVFLTMCVGDRKPTHRHRHTHTKYKCTE